MEFRIMCNLGSHSVPKHLTKQDIVTLQVTYVLFAGFST